MLALRADQTLKTLKNARLVNSYEAELGRLIAVDLLILDDFGLDAMDPTESRDAYEIVTEAASNPHGPLDNSTRHKPHSAELT